MILNCRCFKKKFKHDSTHEVFCMQIFGTEAYFVHFTDDNNKKKVC